MKNPEVIWKTESMPFYWGQLQNPTNGSGLPDSLPFALCVDPETGVLMQAPDTKVSCALENAYAKGSSISGMMDDSGIGKEYAEDFLNFIIRQIGSNNLNGKRILEIGCGTGYLLSRLKSFGADVIGVEPGGHGQIGAGKYDVPIIHDYFPSQKILGHFDFIISYAVLEHIEQPIDFMKKVKSALVPEGKIFLAVPDTEPCQVLGDVSMLLHEHWSYFTQHSLGGLLSAVGNLEAYVEPAGFGGSLYGVAHCQETNEISLAEKPSSILCDEAEAFVQRMNMWNSRLVNFIEEARGKGKIVAIYVPIRIINTLQACRVDSSHLRFIDDNSVLRGSFLPGFPQAVEGRDELINCPTDEVLIMSHTFGEKIKSSLLEKLPASTRITLISDLGRRG